MTHWFCAATAKHQKDLWDRRHHFLESAMASQYFRLARQAPLSALAALASQQACRLTLCDAKNTETPRLTQSTEATTATDDNLELVKKSVAGVRSDEKGDFHGLFPKRQLFQPRLEYPLWDNDWDDYRPDAKMEVVFDSEEERRQHFRHLRKNGITRHIILIRHGQYEENHKVCWMYFTGGMPVTS
jgi:serine/threonine-protein phosphatase PGAM5